MNGKSTGKHPRDSTEAVGGQAKKQKFQEKDQEYLKAKKAADSKKKREKEKKQIYGNYDRYYGYRHVGETDARLPVLPREIFEDKACLDIGCNDGLFTLSIAEKLGVSNMLGLDIDGGLIGRALSLVRSKMAPTKRSHKLAVDKATGRHTQQHQHQPNQKPTRTSAFGHSTAAAPSFHSKFDRLEDVPTDYFPISFEIVYGSLKPDLEKYQRDQEALEKGGSGLMQHSPEHSDAEEEESGHHHDDHHHREEPREVPQIESSESKSEQHMQIEEEVAPAQQTPAAETTHTHENKDEKVEDKKIEDSEMKVVVASETSDPTTSATSSSSGSAADILSHKVLYPFPYNTSFRTCNFVESDEITEQYDTISCFSVTKWIHLNWGDEGIHRLFAKVHKGLKPGGHFVLEPQPWKSYKKKLGLTEAIRKNYHEIKLKPQDFTSCLEGLGFELVHTLKVAGEGIEKGFQRPIFVFRKKEESSKQEEKQETESLGQEEMK